jgi:hypothetical protein
VIRLLELFHLALSESRQEAPFLFGYRQSTTLTDRKERWTSLDDVAFSPFVYISSNWSSYLKTAA